LLGVTLLSMTGSNSMYTYLDVLLGSAVGPAGLGLLIGVFGVGGRVGTWWGGAARSLVVVALCGVAAWGCVPAQQHHLIGLRPEKAPLLLG
jgi:DHA1 family purine base/nucleoside efflux pump-like MFS transporter